MGTKATGHSLWTWSEPGVRVSTVTVLTAGGNSDDSLRSVMIMAMIMMLENDPLTEVTDVRIIKGLLLYGYDSRCSRR